MWKTLRWEWVKSLLTHCNLRRDVSHTKLVICIKYNCKLPLCVTHAQYSYRY